MFQSLTTAGETYPVIEEKVKEGLTFYKRLEANVAKLLKTVEDVLKQHRLLTGEGEPDDGPVNRQSEIETGQPVQPAGSSPAVALSLSPLMFHRRIELIERIE